MDPNLAAMMGRLSIKTQAEAMFFVAWLTGVTSVWKNFSVAFPFILRNMSALFQIMLMPQIEAVFASVFPTGHEKERERRYADFKSQQSGGKNDGPDGKKGNPTAAAYDLMGLVKGEATTADAAKAYRKMALKWHPDKNRDNIAEAEMKMAEINAAYDVVKADLNGDEEGGADGDGDDDAHGDAGDGSDYAYSEDSLDDDDIFGGNGGRGRGRGGGGARRRRGGGRRRRDGPKSRKGKRCYTNPDMTPEEIARAKAERAAEMKQRAADYARDRAERERFKQTRDKLRKAAQRGVLPEFTTKDSTPRKGQGRGKGKGGNDSSASNAATLTEEQLRCAKMMYACDHPLAIALAGGTSGIFTKDLIQLWHQHGPTVVRQHLDKHGNNVLHFACFYGQHPAVALLIQLVGDHWSSLVLSKNNYGQTARDIAELTKHTPTKPPVTGHEDPQDETEWAGAGAGAGADGSTSHPSNSDGECNSNRDHKGPDANAASNAGDVDESDSKPSVNGGTTSGGGGAAGGSTGSSDGGGAGTSQGAQGPRPVDPLEALKRHVDELTKHAVDHEEKSKRKVDWGRLSRFVIAAVGGYIPLHYVVVPSFFVVLGESWSTFVTVLVQTLLACAHALFAMRARQLADEIPDLPDEETQKELDAQSELEIMVKDDARYEIKCAQAPLYLLAYWSVMTLVVAGPFMLVWYRSGRYKQSAWAGDSDAAVGFAIPMALAWMIWVGNAINHGRKSFYTHVTPYGQVIPMMAKLTIARSLHLAVRTMALWFCGICSLPHVAASRVVKKVPMSVRDSLPAAVTAIVDETVVPGGAASTLVTGATLAILSSVATVAFASVL